jgi:hypothetical protein
MQQHQQGKPCTSRTALVSAPGWYKHKGLVSSHGLCCSVLQEVAEQCEGLLQDLECMYVCKQELSGVVLLAQRHLHV